jgi:hypothetical protein
MPPIPLGSLKSVLILLRTYGLRMPVCRSWGRTRFWQGYHSSRRCGLRINGDLSGAAADEGFGAADRLQRPTPRKQKRARLADGSVRRHKAEHPHQGWAMDFQLDATADGRRLKFLNVID